MRSARCIRELKLHLEKGTDAAADAPVIAAGMLLLLRMRMLLLRADVF